MAARRGSWLAPVAATLVALILVAPGMAQRPTGTQAPAGTQNISPAYEGFWRNADGTFDMYFGYYNRGWDKELDIPVGAGNTVEPNGPDGGQPTHFFPRRNQFVFKVRVPATFGNNEVVWTLTTGSVTEKAFGTLRPAYAVDETVMMANFGAGGATGFLPEMMGNKPPTLKLESEKSVTTTVGQPITLTAVATDDGKPGTREIPALAFGQSHFVPDAATGLRLSFYHYRGPGPITFDPPQTKVWEDHRDGGASPWSAGWKTPPVPPNNRWTARATFTEPGTYVVRALASDGGLLDYQDIKVTVTR